VLNGETLKMNTTEIIAKLEEERDRLNEAIAALTNGTGKRRGRPPGSGKKRHQSAAARRRISLAMKKKWAERKKKA
jgi:hypothetical protein